MELQCLRDKMETTHLASFPMPRRWSLCISVAPPLAFCRISMRLKQKNRASRGRNASSDILWGFNASETKRKPSILLFSRRLDAGRRRMAVALFLAFAFGFSPGGLTLTHHSLCQTSPTASNGIWQLCWQFCVRDSVRFVLLRCFGNSGRSLDS